MNWQHLTNIEQLDTIDRHSHQHPVVIFKHSTRCSISTAALDRISRGWQGQVPPHVDAWYLDLITYRNISNEIAKRYGVEHQSPQVLLIQDGKCTYHASHFDISAAELAKHVPESTKN